VHQGETLLIQFQLQSTQKVTQSKGVTVEVGELARKNESDAQIVHHPRVFSCPAGFCALVGVGLDYQVGDLPIALKLPDGSTLDSATVSVRASEKPMERLRVDPSRVKLSAEDQRRVDEERAIVHEALNTARTEDLESFTFALPVRSKETSAFGKKRVFNGEPRGYHTGVDLRAGVGTKIRAANSGVVRLARPLFMAGNHVLVDHGGGIFSSYSHLSEISVKEGQRIALGEIVGKAGSTGRVTAPHLHWTVRVEGEAIDPLQFLKVLKQISDPMPPHLTKAGPSPSF
jgi:murein DD-endopeptidase MepM/ murein hydrolase activator NlpD